MSETTTLTLSEFLKARFTEEHDAAEGNGYIAWLTFREPDGRMRYTAVAAGEPDDYWVVDGVERTDYASVDVVYDWTQVRERVMSQRTIVVQCDRVLAIAEPDWEYTDAYELAATTLRLMAVPYRRHPDFREEWA